MSYYQDPNQQQYQQQQSIDYELHMTAILLIDSQVTLHLKHTANSKVTASSKVTVNKGMGNSNKAILHHSSMEVHKTRLSTVHLQRVATLATSAPCNTRLSTATRTLHLK